MGKYTTKAKVRVRVINEENQSGFSWFKQPDEDLEADTIEELADLAAKIKPPDNIDATAIAVEMTLYLTPDNTFARNRKTVQLNTFREI